MEIKYIEKEFNPFDCKLGRAVGNFEELQYLYNLKPNDGVEQPFIVLDENGYVKVNDILETNIKGVYAIGDIIKKDTYQLVTAASDGARVIYNMK